MAGFLANRHDSKSEVMMTSTLIQPIDEPIAQSKENLNNNNIRKDETSRMKSGQLI